MQGENSKLVFQSLKCWSRSVIETFDEVEFLQESFSNIKQEDVYLSGILFHLKFLIKELIWSCVCLGKWSMFRI